MRFLTLIFILIAVARADLSLAQQVAKARIEGQITDNRTGETLEGVHVFISRSSTGAVSRQDGTFRMMVPLGAHRIVVSRIGYTAQTHDVMIRAPQAFLFDVKLDEEVIELGKLTVSGDRDPDRDKHLQTFIEFFVGETANASDVRILNPEVLDFYREDGKLLATTIAPLEIENRALGYLIEHHLHEFMVDGEETWQDGESFFQELVPSSEEEAQDWRRNRLEAFNGSAQHFFASMMQNRTRQEGFLVYQVEDPGVVGSQSEYCRNQAAPLQTPQFAVNPTTLLTDGASEQERIFDFPDYLHIIYTREPEDQEYARWQRIYHSGEVRHMQHSWLRLSGGALLDNVLWLSILRTPRGPSSQRVPPLMTLYYCFYLFWVFI